MRKAKDSLKEMISGYEKQTGTRLRGIAPIPLIGFYLRVYAEHSKLPMSVDFKLFNQIRKTVGQSVSAVSRYIEALTGVNGVKEIVVGVVVATAVSTGTVGVIQHNQPTEPEPNPIVEEKEDTKKEEDKQDQAPQGVIEHPVENHTYFIYWDSKTIDISSYVHEGDYYEDPTYGRIKKWLICEDALLQLPLTKKVVNGANVYCYDDGTDKYEFVINGTNSYTINGAPYTYDMEVQVIDGKKYINPYHLFQNMFGMTNFSAGGGSGGNFVAMKTKQYQPPTTSNQGPTNATTQNQSSGQNNQGQTGSITTPGNQSSADAIMGSISNQIPPVGGYQNGDTYVSSRFQSIADFLRNEKGGGSLVVEGTTLNYFNSIYVSYNNADGSWMYLRLAKWYTNTPITEDLENQVYLSLPTTLNMVMGIICGAGGDYGLELYQKVINLVGEYSYPEKIPTQGQVEEDVPGLTVTMTQSPDGLEIRYFAE